MTAALNLLLVEDSPSDARLLEACLYEGLLGVGSVEREATLKGGLDRLGQGAFDAVLLDLGLPDSSGLDTIRQVVTSNPEVPVVVVSGLSDASVAEQAVALGAQDYVLKGAVTPKDLARAVTYAIRRQEVVEESAQAKRDQLDSKDRFLSHVSHELRTPLAAVHQFVSLVADETVGPLGDEQRECLVVAMRNIRQLALMIGDLLVMGRMSSGLVEMRPEPCRMLDMIEECASTFRALAEHKGVKIDVDVYALDLPDVWCDPVRTAEVLDNLLDNAVKFTPAGGSIALTATLSDDDIRVAVRDTGRGVQLENHERVFEQYFREAGDGDSGRGGLGLGLFVCRELVERQAGRIWLEMDASARGACFQFTLPTTIRARTNGSVTMTRSKILIVEDDDDLRHGLTRRLTASGYDVAVAADGLAAISAALTERPDLVLLDIGLPGGSGLAVLRRYADCAALLTTPVVVLTGRDPLAIEGEVRGYGVAGFLTKPADNEELLRVIARALRGEPDPDVEKTASGARR